LQVQAFHWQLLEQVWVPLVSQVWVAAGAQAPWPVQVPQADQLPLLQVRVCVPQLPQACEVGPVHVQDPATQLEPPGQALPHAPQLARSDCSLTQVLPQSENPALQLHAPHWQLAEQVSVPLVSQACVALGAQAPWPAQVPQADQVPLLQVRVWLPQLPQACEVGPVHVQDPAAQLEPPGQALPHAPQLLGSVCSSTQTPVQLA
jgi:hypothetical protein